ncbi:hypothetical protein LCGC14_2776500, partial [marine sediment metagenome]
LDKLWLGLNPWSLAAVTDDDDWVVTGLWVPCWFPPVPQDTKASFTFSAVSFDDDSMLVMVIDMSPTATLALQLQMNSNTTANYFFGGYRILGGVQTLVSTPTQTSIELTNSAISTINANVFGIINFGVGKASTAPRPLVTYKFLAGTTSVQDMVGSLVASDNEINEIIVKTSTSTWRIGTRMTLYKVARA